METIKKIVCTTCGSPIDNIDLSQKTAVCAFCGNQFVIQNAAELSKIEVDKTKDLKNNREMLNSAIKNGNLKGIVRYSGKILEIIPEDYASKYYYAYAQYELDNNSKYIQEFYKTPAQLYTEKELENIITHIINNSKLRDRLIVEKYIMSLENVDTFGYLQKYKKEFNQRKQKEEDYDDIVRDVFVCHRSTNVDIAELLVKALEEDGNKCWISTRNLRPNDAENYWDNISKAINSCKVFLVVSSEDAMMSGDVKNEINIAKSLDKPRVEYKIDNSERTTFFKDFFSGKKWIEGTGDARSLTLLCSRVYDELCNLTHKEKKQDKIDELAEIIKSQSAATAVPVAIGGASVDSLIKRAKIEIEDEMFEEAEASLNKLLDIAPDNPEVWWLKLLVECEASTDVDLGTRSNLDCVKSRNFINAEKYADSSQNSQIITNCQRLQNKVNKELAEIAKEKRIQNQKNRQAWEKSEQIRNQAEKEREDIRNRQKEVLKKLDNSYDNKKSVVHIVFIVLIVIGTILLTIISIIGGVDNFFGIIAAFFIALINVSVGLGVIWFLVARLVNGKLGANKEQIRIHIDELFADELFAKDLQEVEAIKLVNKNKTKNWYEDTDAPYDEDDEYENDEYENDEYENDEYENDEYEDEDGEGLFS